VRTAAVKMIKVLLKGGVRGDRLGETRTAIFLENRPNGPVLFGTGQIAVQVIRPYRQVQVQVAKSQRLRV
jgi:hypothetical protein